MKRRLLAAWLFTACAGEVSDETTLEVECIGMSRREAIAGYYVIQTDVAERCRLLLSDTVYDPQNVELVAQSGGNWGQPNTGTLLIRHAGKLWIGRSGSLRLDTLEDTRGSGRYELLADNEAGETATLTGPIQFCEYGADPDCPHQSSGVSALSKRVEFRDPDSFSADGDTTRASDCRVLIHREKAAVQVDLQLAVINGINQQRWLDMCGPATLTSNSFQFRARGVTGPGEWASAPVRQQVSDDGQTEYHPDFVLDAPNVAFLGNCLAFASRSFSVVPTQETACSFSISEEPGRFELNCTQARHREPGHEVDGEFRLSADCDVRYKEE